MPGAHILDTLWNYLLFLAVGEPFYKHLIDSLFDWFKKIGVNFQVFLECVSKILF